MVQEFHVLRCFSCRTFQVQQVKKTKKWSCKMCGEKQSLIKEYGRGTGADCRRHVQKLNSLRGELLEVEHERAWTEWEKEEECEDKVGPGDEPRSKSCEQKLLEDRDQLKVHYVGFNNLNGPPLPLPFQVCIRTYGGHQGQVVSRWSKYVDQKENGSGCDEDEYKEEENVYTDTQRYRQRTSIRKRKKSFTSGAVFGRCTVGGDEDMDTAHGGAMGRPSQPRRHDGTFKSSPQVPRSCSGTSQRTDALGESPTASLGSKHISAFNGTCSQSAELSTKPQPSVPLSSVPTPSFSHQHPSAYKPQAKDSKWARFLPSDCTEDDDDDDDGDGGEHAPCGETDCSTLVQSPEMPVASVPLKNTVCMSSGGGEGALLGKVFGVGKVTVFEKLSHCGNGNVCKLPNSPTFTSGPVVSQKPVCVQPLPNKRPRSTLSISTLFHTDEDFDETY